MYKLALIFLCSFFVVLSPAAASGAQDKWTVTQLSGDARVVHPGLQPASLKVSAQIVSGDILITGATGRATLVRGADYIIIAPRSELRLPATAEATGFTRVVEELGTMLFKIQHTGIPHFAVDTPMLAAVVKGTTFSITVDQNRSAVQVIQGAVQVTAVVGGMSRIVEGGRTVFVNHADPTTLLDADKPAPPTSAPSSNSVNVLAADDNPIASVSQLTQGLVRVEADSPQTPARAVDATLQSNTTVTAVSPTSTPATDTSAVTVAGATTPGVTGAGVSTPSATVTPTTVASVSTPAVSVPGVSTPGVTVPGVSTPAVTVPSVTVTVSTPVGAVPSVSTPAVTVPSVTVASVSTPTVTVPSVSTPTITVPSVTVASVSTPTVTVPSVSTPTITVPSVTVASVSTPTVTVPSVSTPTATVPSVTIPAVSTPTVSTPAVTIPSVTVPSITTPIVSVPTITTPAITVPSITVPCLFGC
jgi:FecR-like protein